jgi:Amt family ammonium transporter
MEKGLLAMGQNGKASSAQSEKTASILPMRLIVFAFSSLGLWLVGLSVASADVAHAQDTTVMHPRPTIEQRVAGLEAYIRNSDPSASLKGADRRIPDGLTSPSMGIAGPGHNAWMMVSAALVLFMTLPGLALFYGGLVRRKNALSVLAQCLGIAGLVTILWWMFGYSLVFGEGGNPFFGSLKHIFLRGVSSTPNTTYAYWVSENIFAMYQLMFAIITPALIVGAIAERMKFSATLLFVGLWMFVVYFPLAHMVWGVDGLMNGVWNGGARIRAIDFAGGTVVHMSSGWSALVLCLIVGKRLGFGKEPMPPHSMVLCMVGTGMLWVGWYGFNAGSALGADGIAANAFVATTISAAVASFVWSMAEWVFRGKPSVLGFCSGVVAGLVVVTPAAGFVDSNGAVVIGIFAGLIPFSACWKLKAWLRYDDALDTFGVHAIGGTLGALLTGVLATSTVNSNLTIANTYAADNGLVGLVAGGGLVYEQLKAVIIAMLLSVVGTTVIAFVVKAIIGLRPSEEAEVAGLDLTEHGEEGYITT